MTLEIKIGGREPIVVKNGNFAGFEDLRELLGGHPCGISRIETSDARSMVRMVSGYSIIGGREMSNLVAVHTRRGHPSVRMGQLYEERGNSVEVRLKDQDSVGLTSQDTRIVCRHIKPRKGR